MDAARASVMQISRQYGSPSRNLEDLLDQNRVISGENCTSFGGGQWSKYKSSKFLIKDWTILTTLLAEALIETKGRLRQYLIAHWANNGQMCKLTFDFDG